jgi:hypothetical protein
MCSLLWKGLLALSDDLVGFAVPLMILKSGLKPEFSLKTFSSQSVNIRPNKKVGFVYVRPYLYPAAKSRLIMALISFTS